MRYPCGHRLAPPSDAGSRCAMPDIHILIIDDEPASQSALKQVLDSEGWKVTIVPMVRDSLPELARGKWSLVIVNVAMCGLDGPLFDTLRELNEAEAGKARIAVLFLVPELAAPSARPALERARLPYVLKPYHLHEFLERVGDLLLDVKAIADPIRQVKRAASERRRRERRGGFDRRSTPMFASRADYQFSEEELAEYEKMEAEEAKRKPLQDKTRLGQPDR